MTTGRQLQGDYAPQWHRQNETSQSWWQTFFNFCRLKSLLLPKGEPRAGIFCGIRSFLCQRYPMGPSTLQTNWSALHQAQLSTENKKRPLWYLGLCLQVATHANLRPKCHTAKNTCLLSGRIYQFPITLGISAPFWSSSLQYKPFLKKHTLYLTLSALLQFVLTCHLKCKHK